MKPVQIILDSLKNLASGLGTSRDKRSHTVIVPPLPLTQVDVESMYRSGMGKRIVNSVADDMTRKWRELQFDEEQGDASDILTVVEDLERALAVQEKVNEALRWARLYGGSAILIGIKGQEPRQPLVPEQIKQGSLEYLRVVDRYRLTAGPNLTADLASHNFGKPDYYTLAESQVNFHHSRVIRFDGQRLPNQLFINNGYWHDSELQHVMSELKDYSTVFSNIASMMFEANVDVIRVTNLAEQLAERDGPAKVISRFQTAFAMKSNIQTLVLDSEEGYEKRSNSFSGLSQIATLFMQVMCSVTEIPMTRLFGTSPGGLNSTGDGDLSNYYDSIGAKQEAELRPQLEGLDQVLLRSALGRMPDGYRFRFHSLWQVSDKDRADIDYKRAQTDKLYWDMGVVDEGVIAADLKEKGTYMNLTLEDVELAQELAEANRNKPDDPALPALPNGAPDADPGTGS